MATFTDDVWQKQRNSISSIRGRQEQSGWEGERVGGTRERGMASHERH